MKKAGRVFRSFMDTLRMVELGRREGPHPLSAALLERSTKWSIVRMPEDTIRYFTRVEDE
jgi:hypothetical protein